MWNAKIECSLVISVCSRLPQCVLDYQSSHVLGVLPINNSYDTHFPTVVMVLFSFSDSKVF